MSDLVVTTLGTSAAIPTTKRNVSSVAVQREGDYHLFDCGEGTQRQMQRFTGLKAPDAIWITHYHPDHWLGLPGILASLALQDHNPDKVLWVYGPSDGIQQIKSVCKAVGAHPSWVEFRRINPGEPTLINNAYTVTPYKTDHTSHSQGYIFEEPDRPGRFDPRIATFAGLEPGPEFAALQRGEIVKGVHPSDVIGPARRGRRVVISGDSRPVAPPLDPGAVIDVLIHEATFSDQNAARARKTKHSTGAEAASIAEQFRTERLVLTHFSPRESVREIAEQASKVFSPSEAAHDGMKIKVPLED